MGNYPLREESVIRHSMTQALEENPAFANFKKEHRFQEMVSRLKEMRRGFSMETVRLQSLSKTYSGGKPAVQQVTLTLNSGEVFGFLGPNGAGKTTTVKLLNGMLSPSEGSCRVLDLNPTEEPEKYTLYPE